jgi:competence protein ComEC
LAGIAVGCWLAALACLRLHALVGWGIAGIALVAALAVGLRASATAAGRHAVHRPLGWIVVTVAVGVVCGAAATAARVGERDEQPLAGLARAHAAVRVRVTVTDDPRVTGRYATVLAPASLAWLESSRGPRIALGARILVLANDRGWLGLLPGQQVEASGTLSPPDGTDLRAAVLSVDAAPTWIGRPSLVERAAAALRSGLQRACAPLPAGPGGLLPGLVVGDVSRLDPALKADFQTTGLTHLVAVSGANCAILLGLVLFTARRCRIGPRVSAVLCAFTLVGFVILARPSPSVLRAAAMGGLALAALASGRPKAGVPALATAVVALVVVDPELAGNAGFALSACATGGLMLLAPGWAAALEARRVPGFLAEALAVPAAAHAACSPIIAALSSTVSLTAIPANMLAEPAVAPATVLGVAAAVVSPFWPSGAAFIAWLASWPARWLVAVARHGAQVPDGVVPWPAGATGGLILAALLVALLVAARRPLVRRLVLVAAVAAVAGAVPVRVVAPGWPPPGWLMVVCDVGQGDAIVLDAAPHRAVVVDAGPEPAAVDGCLRRLHVDTVSLLVLTHFHADHVGGLDGVFAGRTIEEILVSPFDEPADGHLAVTKAAAAHRVPVEVAAPGASGTTGALAFTVLGPVRTYHGTRSDPNNNSVVMRVLIGGQTVLLTGDAENEEQQSLLETVGAAGLRASVLKVAHHGSAYQDPSFLAAVAPSVALVSVGAHNDYGHPNAVLMAKLSSDGARVLRTDQSGDLAVLVDDNGLAVATGGARTAQH